MIYNLNSIYLCDIYVKYFTKKSDGTIIYKGKFVKKAIIEHVYANEYVDIITGEHYRYFSVNDCKLNVGEMYIKIENGMIPIAQIIETNRKELPKRRILQNYDLKRKMEEKIKK